MRDTLQRECEDINKGAVCLQYTTGSGSDLTKVPNKYIVLPKRAICGSDTLFVDYKNNWADWFFGEFIWWFGIVSGICASIITGILFWWWEPELWFWEPDPMSWVSWIRWSVELILQILIYLKIRMARCKHNIYEWGEKRIQISNSTSDIVSKYNVEYNGNKRNKVDFRGVAKKYQTRWDNFLAFPARN